MQSEASECGIACLAMITNYYGNDISLREFRQAMPASSEGAKLTDLMQYAQQIGLSCRALKADLNDIINLRKPCILHWEFSHFVVLTKVKRTSVTILDPAIGKRELSIKEFSQSFTGVCLELSPNASFQKKKSKPSISLTALIRPIIGIKRQLALMVVISIILQLFALLSPLYMQTVIDQVLVNNAQSLILIVAIGFSLLMIIDTLTAWLRDTVVLKFSHEFNLLLSNNVLAHLLRLPVDYFQKRHIGDVVSRFGSLQAIRDIISQGVVSAFIDGLLAILTLIVMFVYSVKLALLVLSITLLYTILRWWLFYPVKQLNQQILHSEAKQQTYFMQSIRAIETIKLSGSEEKTRSTWTNMFINNSNQQIKLGQWNIAFSTCNKFIFGIENILVIYIGASLVMANNFTIGMLIAFISFKKQFTGATANFLEKWIEYKILDVHLNRIDDIVNHPSEDTDEYEKQLVELDQNTPNTSLRVMAKNKMLSECKVKEDVRLELTNVEFRYHPSSDAIFKNVNLKIDNNSFTAIIGRSGCGKSSLLNCLLGLSKPTSGEVLINGQALNAATRKLFNIAAVLQSDNLLNGSILDNITNFAEQVDLEKAVYAAQQACIHTDILSMTMQYQTLIGDMGDSLSGGQKQRILLARAFYQKPDLLILDEATSHLDVNTEKQICDNLKSMNTAIVMVAHRPQTISIAEQVYSLSSKGLTQVSNQDDFSQNVN